MKKTMLTAAMTVLGFAAGGNVVQAADVLEPAAKVVAYDDLNLDSDKGAQVFYNRVNGAAHEVCARLASRELAFANAWNSCMDHAIGAAVSKVNNAKVTALYDKSMKESAGVKFASLR